ncbi:MAG: biopolymer transporter ExbD [Chitinophagaceae bacterium]|nr:biopolymer transporter ExbD [Chitinophagaceae bacterium]
MARPKLPRKSTTIDMTAMCDVAFLLLSFFILTTKFKPSEAVPINTPTSVSSKIAPEKDVILISFNKEGKVFLSMDDKEKKRAVLNTVNVTRNLGLSGGEMKALVDQPFIGFPIAQLKQQASLPSEQLKGSTSPGIPARDSINNEMMYWVSAVSNVYQGQKKPNLLVKGDNEAKYPTFKYVVAAFKKYDFMTFQMVTNPENVPRGSELYRLSLGGKQISQ